MIAISSNDGSGSTGKGVSGKTLAEILELMNTKHGSAVQWVVKKDPSGVLANNIEYGHVFPIPSSGLSDPT